MRARTALFVALVVSLAGAAAFSGLGLSSVENLGFARTRQEAISAASIASAELTEMRPASSLRVYWRQPGTLSVTVNLRPQSKRSVEQNWRCLQEDWKEIRTAVASLSAQATTSCDSFALHAGTTGGGSLKWTWCTATETGALKEVREMIEHKAHADYSEATAHLERGRDQVGERQFAAAVASFKNGIQALGKSYLDPSSTLDDTGMKLVLAQAKEKEGKLDTASAILERVLETRLSLYASRHMSAATSEQ